MMDLARVAEEPFSFNPFDPEVRYDPFPFYARARREHPVFADLNLYPTDIDQLLAGKEKALAMVNAMNL